jgi:hypothetical protein
MSTVKTCSWTPWRACSAGPAFWLASTIADAEIFRRLGHDPNADDLVRHGDRLTPFWNLATVSQQVEDRVHRSIMRRCRSW